MAKYIYNNSIREKIRDFLFGSRIREKIGSRIKNIPVERIDMKSSVSEVKKQLATFVTTAFALTAAFFWNDAIKAMITSYIPYQAGNWPYLMWSAVIVTLIAVVVTVLIAKTLGGSDK